MRKNKPPHYSVCIGVGYVICTVQLENSNFLCGALAVIIVIIIIMIIKMFKKCNLDDDTKKIKTTKSLSK